MLKILKDLPDHCVGKQIFFKNMVNSNILHEITDPFLEAGLPNILFKKFYKSRLKIRFTSKFENSEPLFMK